MKTTKHKLFSVTLDDCRVDTFCSGGKGGQHQNATKSGVRITHLAADVTDRYLSGLGAYGCGRDDKW